MMESNAEAITQLHERRSLDYFVEKYCKTENRKEEDETEKYVIDSIFDNTINKIRLQCYVKYG